MADIADRHPKDESDREARVNNDAPLGDGVILRKMSVEVVLVCIHREQGKPRVISLVDGPPEWMLVHIADREGLEVISQAGFMHGHRLASRRGVQSKV